MGRSRVDLLVEELDDAYGFLRGQVEGLSDEELYWEPVPGTLSIRENRGENPPELFRSTPNTRAWYAEYEWVWVSEGNAGFADVGNPPVPRSIGLVLVHVAACKHMYHQDAFAPGGTTFDDLVPHTAADAITLLDEGQARLREAVARLPDDTALEETRVMQGTNWGEEWPILKVLWTLVSHDLHHGAEIGTMRQMRHWLGVR